jgi:hypothetical protein
MLDQAKKDKLEHVDSWKPHERCFVVHKRNDFEQMILQKYVLTKVFC